MRSTNFRFLHRPALAASAATFLIAALPLVAQESGEPDRDREPSPAGGLAIGLPVDPATIVSQSDHPDTINGCAPASILNLLAAGGDTYAPVRKAVLGRDDAVRLRFLTERYFQNRKSSELRGQMRWRPHGVSCVDFAAGLNELLAESGLRELPSVFLDRRTGEEDADFQERVRRQMEDSLLSGTPPVLALRSYAARRRDGEGAPAWQVLRQHFVVIASVESGEQSGRTGFRAMAMDSNGARQVELHFFNESSGQAFRALRGSEEAGAWLDGRPFLLVLAPEVRALRPANLEWSERFLVTAHFLMGDF